MKQTQSTSARGGATRILPVLVAAFSLILAAFVIAGCSCSAQSSSSASSASASASSSASGSAAQAKVPDVTGLKQADAEARLKDAGFVLGAVTQESSDTVSEGLVMKQNPAAQTDAASGTKVDLVISKGKKAAEQVAVPDLKGKNEEDAKKALSDVKLVGEKGDSVETSDVEAGLVYQQSVAAGTKVDEGTKVVYQLATKKVATVPNVTGKASADAKAAIENAGLKYEASDAYSDTVAKDIVISQSLAADTKVEVDTVVAVQVSQGPKPADQVVVPDIMGITLSEAKYALDNAGLKYTYSGDENGFVATVDPAAGTKVDVGSTVTFTLEKQTTYVVVPDVTGMTGPDAEAQMNAVGLNLSYDHSNAGTIESTNPAAGASVEEGSTITAVFSEIVTDWTSASSASAAAKSAGIGSFDVPSSVYRDGVSYPCTGYAYITGAAQATYEGPALMFIVRKGVGMSFDALTADLGSYGKSWKQNFKGLEISCSGDSKKAASIMKWKIGDTRYVAAGIGLGGENVGLAEDEVSSLVAGIQ